MSNYTQVTFFAPKDSLLSGNPAKIIKGADVDPELAAIAVAIATKYDSTSIATGQIAFNDGTVGAPSVTFVGSLTTGIYLPSANALGLATSGVQRLLIASGGLITANGAVLISGSGGSNNAELDINNTDASGGHWRIGDAIGTSAGTLTVYDAVNTAVRLKLSSAGALTVNAPASANTALTVNGAAGGVYTQIISGSSTSGQSYGLAIVAGTTSGDAALVVQNQAQTLSFFEILGDGHGFLGPNSTNTLSWTTTGAFTISAPTGTNYGLVVNGSSTSGQSFGQFIKAGTTSADQAFLVQPQAGGTNYFVVQGDGQVYVAQPSAASAGPATTFQVGYLDIPQNAQGGNYQLVMSDRGKHIYLTAAGHTITIPANATTAFPIGTAITIIANNPGGVNSIGIVTDALYWLPSGTGGAGAIRTLANYGSATLLKVTATSWVITGVGIS